MFDLLIVGGGLLGAGIARDAAGRGLSVCLLEQEDFGAGATGHASGLVAGGLSALETLDFARVREQISEREILLRTAPDLVVHRRCLIPFYGHGLLAQARVRSSLALADALGFDHSVSVHQLLPAAEILGRAPALVPEGLSGGALVWEAATPHPARLALALALDARRAGATLCARTRVDSLCWGRDAGGRAHCLGVLWTDMISGQTGETSAALTVLAAGAWLPGLGSPPEALPPLVQRLSLLAPPLGGEGDALVFPRDDGHSPLLAVPVSEGTWLGDWELPLTAAPDVLYAARAAIEPLVSALTELLPAVTAQTLRAAWAAPVAPPPPPMFSFGAAVPSHGLADGAAETPAQPGLLTVWGGGPTSFRAIAEEAVDLACRKLGRALSTPSCQTATQPLPAPPLSPLAASPSVIAQVAAKTECRTLSDFLLRRLDGPPPAPNDPRIPEILSALAAHFGWDVARQARERKDYAAQIALTQAFRVL